MVVEADGNKDNIHDAKKNFIITYIINNDLDNVKDCLTRFGNIFTESDKQEFIKTVNEYKSNKEIIDLFK